MSEPMPDDELNRLFARQRAADHENAPSFHAMRTGTSEAQPASGTETSMPWVRWATASVAAALLAVALLQTVHRPSPPSPLRPDLLAERLDAIDAALQKSLAAQHDLSAWQSPTDFLLPPIHHLDQP